MSSNAEKLAKYLAPLVSAVIGLGALGAKAQPILERIAAGEDISDAEYAGIMADTDADLAELKAKLEAAGTGGG